jgi:hypothetical protein
MNLLVKLCLFFVLAGLSNNVLSQTPTGSIKGVVRDTVNSEFIQGASVKIKGNANSTVSNNKGEFIFDNLEAGQYIISISVKGFKTWRDTVVLTAGQNVDLGVIFPETEAVTFKGSRVVFRRPKTTIAEGVKQQKEAEGVSNVQTSEEFKTTQASNAGQVASRIPGVTLMENRFIMLRGLSQRYNSVQINNINAPSTETDRRAFSFDLIPSSALDQMAVFKSPSSDLAGDFAGGVIKLLTKNEIEKDFFSVNIGLGYRVNTTFSKHQNNSVNSSTDMLGFDNGNRDLPSSFPKSLADLSTKESVSYGKQMRNNFDVNSFTAPLDFGFGFGFGKNIKLKKNELYTVNNFSYSTNYQFAAMQRYRFQNDPVDYVKEMFHYNDDNFSIESKIGILSNWILKTNRKASYTFKNIFNQIGENETTIRTGVTLTERPSDEFRNYSFHYTSRSIYFGQFEGQHKLRKKGDKFVYTLGYSHINRDEPDFRRFRTFRNIGTNDPYTLIDPSSATPFDAARFYSKLKENTVSANINLEKHFINRIDSTKDIVLRLGTYAESKARNFNARWISYSYTGDPTNKNEFLVQPIDRIFSEGNINTAAGFRPLEGTNPSDKYAASNNLLSAYVNSSIPFSNMNLNVGVRSEYFNQVLTSATQTEPLNVDMTNLNILPSVNFAYYFVKAKDTKNKKNAKNTLLRLTYGKTVNRPEFREIAPFLYYDFMYDLNVAGNPDLVSAKIDNVDIRFENYPTKNETVNIGFFYKRFLNPIENYVQVVGLSPQFYLKNAKSATNMGAELEVRKSFEQQSQNAFIKNLSMVLNASYIISEVDLGDDSTLSQASKRPLQGQSPYIFNLTLQYRNDSGLTVNVAYNIFGKRIAFVGNNLFPTVYEMPRHSLDLTVTKEINKKFSLKFGVSDVLNFKHQLWQDTNNDGDISYTKGTDHQLLEYRRGQLINFGISYKIK